jgi:hypothetical protein
MTDSLARTPDLFEDERSKNETECEIVNEEEIYLSIINEAGTLARGRRICGHLRVADGRRLRCRMAAGASTNHFGIGRCTVHESLRGGKGRNLRLLKKHKAAGIALDLKELLLIEPELLNDKKLGEIGEEIIVLEQLLKEMLNTAPVIDSNGNPMPVMMQYGNEILGLISSLVAVKVAKGRMETDKLLIDMNSIRLFVNGIFEAAKRVLSRDAYSRFVVELEGSMIMPLNKPMQRLIADAEIVEDK